MNQGFIKVAAGTPTVTVADCKANTKAILEIIHEMEEQQAKIMVLPELCITGYTCQDLFLHRRLLDSAWESLLTIAEESTIAKLEENVQKIQSVTTLLEQGHTPESLLEQVLDGFDIEINDTIPTEFYCNCSKERVEKALISIGRKELNEMIQEGKPIEMNCHFCNTNYNFTVEELKEILRRCK